MIDDQANQLRRLVGNDAGPAAPAPGEHPCVIVLGSGKGGVGTTTLALNLAVALARRRLRTVFVDADSRGGSAALLCAVEQRCTLGDVLSGRRSIPEALQTGPGNVQVLGGGWGGEGLGDRPSAAERLLEQLHGLGAEFEFVVLDPGNLPTQTARRLWQAADRVLAVTSPETISILNTYSMIKAFAEDGHLRPIHSLINLVPTAGAAEEAHRRLARACRRFLGIAMEPAGGVPVDSHVPASARAQKPLVLAAPRCAAARRIERLAAWLLAAAGEQELSRFPRIQETA